MKKTTGYITKIIVLTMLIFVSASFPAFAEADPWYDFVAGAAGRYFAVSDEGMAVLELIPAFGQLFGAVGYYMEGSLYSYYAADFIPLCTFTPGNCAYSSNSVDFVIRLYSNMSNAGNYWDGSTQQRLTLVFDDLYLSNFEGTGYGLISREPVFLRRTPEVPSLFPYTAEMAAGSLENPRIEGIPDILAGSYRTSWQVNEESTVQQVSFEKDGTMMLLRRTGSLPPLLLKGGYALSANGDGSFELCYLLSSPSSGTMPYGGCAMVMCDDMLIVSEGDSPDRLLTGSPALQIYHR